MRKAILVVSMLTAAWPFAADAQTATTLAPNTTSSAVGPNSQTTPPATPQKPAPISHKAKAKTPTKTTTQATKPSTLSSAVVNSDPCDSAVASATAQQTTPDANNSNDTSIQCNQDKSKPMQGGLVGHR